MNLTNLFEIQRKLDAEIEEKHPTAAGEDRLAKRILALQVELGECANEWRGFKFWSNNPFPDPARESYPLLEEYVDCLHFILSIGLELGFQNRNLNTVAVEGIKQGSVTKQFNFLFTKIGDFNIIKNHNNYMYIVPLFIGLGEMLGFTWEQIEEAYMSKNKTNWERQANGY